MGGAGHMDQRVQTDEVAQPQGGAAGPAQDRAGNGIDLFHGEAAGLHPPQGIHDREEAEAVGDEVRRIPAGDDTLAEAALQEGGQFLDPGGIGVGTRDHLDELHVPRGVEEVNPEEAPLKLLRESLGEGGDRQAGGIGRQDRRGPQVPLHLLEEGALDLQVLDHGLDHPLCPGEGRGVTQGARTDPVGYFGQEQRARAQPPQPLQSGPRAPGLVGPVRKVEEVDLDPGIGQQSRDLAAHDAGAEHRGPSDLRAVRSLVIRVRPRAIGGAHARRPSSPPKRNS